MLGQITPDFDLEQGYQVSGFDEELVFGALLGGKGAGVAFVSQFLNPPLRLFAETQCENPFRVGGRHGAMTLPNISVAAVFAGITGQYA
jgi:hypothetical protein